MSTRKIVEVPSYSSTRKYDDRVIRTMMYASIENTSGPYSGPELWMVIRRGSPKGKRVFTCKLADWADVMSMFDELTISVAEKSLREMFPDKFGE